MYITVQNKTCENIRIRTTEKSELTGELENVEYNFFAGQIENTSGELQRVIDSLIADNYLHVIDLYNMALDPDTVIQAHAESAIEMTSDISYLRSKWADLIDAGIAQEEYYKAEIAKHEEDETYEIESYKITI